jgi:hypothetical protein
MESEAAVTSGGIQTDSVDGERDEDDVRTELKTCVMLLACMPLLLLLLLVTCDFSRAEVGEVTGQEPAVSKPRLSKTVSSFSNWDAGVACGPPSTSVTVMLVRLVV